MDYTEIKHICKTKNFYSFWEAFDFLLLSGSSETEALLVSLEIFEGDIWSKVIDVDIDRVDSEADYGNDFPMPDVGNDNGDEYNIIDDEWVPAPEGELGQIRIIENNANEVVIVDQAGGVNIGVYDRNEEVDYDALTVTINLLTRSAVKEYLPIYKSYVDTKRYSQIFEIDHHINEIKISITSNIIIRLFDEWKEKNK